MAEAPPSLEQVKESRRQQLDAENAMLDKLHGSIMQTHEMAKVVGGELSEQERMLGRLQGNVERANVETAQQNRSVLALLQQSKHSGFYFAVIALVIVIIFLLFL
jgi:hypothetical protein